MSRLSCCSFYHYKVQYITVLAMEKFSTYLQNTFAQGKPSIVIYEACVIIEGKYMNAVIFYVHVEFVATLTCVCTCVRYGTYVEYDKNTSWNDLLNVRCIDIFCLKIFDTLTKSCSCVENEYCCPRTVNKWNVTYTYILPEVENLC